VTALAWAAPFLILGGVIALAWSILAGHEQLACLPRTITTHAARALLTVAIVITGGLLKVAGPALIPAARITAAACGVARHPAWWARYARARRHPAPGPGRDDGGKLSREEHQVLRNLAEGRDVRART
jgi:DNA-binding NarL/FixJ family response regulator